MYEIPVFSAVTWMLPLAGKKGMHWQFNRTTNPYSTSAWHADACCHPKRSGHLILSLVIAFCLLEEEKAMLSLSTSDTADGEHDFTSDATPVMREPIYLSPEEDDVYVSGEIGGTVIDFTHPDNKAWEKNLLSNIGWEWFADNKVSVVYVVLLCHNLLAMHCDNITDLFW